MPIKKTRTVLRPIALASFGNIDLERHIRESLSDGVGYNNENNCWNH